MSSYWLDSDVLIFAKDNFAPFGVPSVGFWNMLAPNIEKGVIKITRRNYKEMTEGRDKNDELAIWLRMRKKEHACVAPDKDVQAFVTKIGDYVYSNDLFLDRHRRRFSNGADPWLIAQAAVDHGTVVTREISQPLSRAPKIPDICKEFDVKFTTLLGVIKILGA